jgi:hypothetical protein
MPLAQAYAAVPPVPVVPLVDGRASRLAQGLTALLTLIPIATGRWGLLVLPLAHLLSALVVGRRGNLGLLAFEVFLARRLGPGELKDARPPRFANLVGAIFLLASLGAHLTGVAWLGWTLCGVVTVLAALAATTGFCLGCSVYVLYRRVQPHLHHRSDPKHVG